MIESLPAPAITKPEIAHLITEDDEPVDNIFSAKQQRLLVSPLYSSWEPGRPFLADSNVGLFLNTRQPPVMPDMFLSLDVQITADWFLKEHRSYFVWKFGKPPEVAVEVVSNKEGEEAGAKFGKYARLGVLYYAIFDPQHLIQPEDLRLYELVGGLYRQKRNYRLEQLELSLTLWEGLFEEGNGPWLRWCDLAGRLIPTGDERAEWEHEQAERERRRANYEWEQAQQAREQAALEHEQAARERLRAAHADAQAARERLRAEQADAQAKREQERAEQERLRAEHADAQAKREQERAEQERLRAEQAEFFAAEARTRAAEAQTRAAQETTARQLAEEKAIRLAARLKALGLDPNGEPQP
jgi:Uma2 family endonuclease